MDALVVIPNDRIFTIIGQDTSFLSSFEMVDDILKQAVQGISDLITMPGIINVDFNDVKAIMQNAGSALMGIGIASGEERAVKAARAAINSPLLEISIDGAKGVLFNVSGGADLGMLEINAAAKVITEAVDQDAKIIFGAVHDPRLKKGEIKMTVIATGFGDFKGIPRNNPQHIIQKPSPAAPAHHTSATDSVRHSSQDKADAQAAQQAVHISAAGDKKQEQKHKPFAPEVTKIPDDGWDIPAFMRRKK